MLQTRHLLLIDRLLQVPYRVLWYGFSTTRKFSAIKTGNDNRAVILKFMGMGSIIRIASIWEKSHVDFDKIALCTFIQNKEVCELLGFKHTIYIRTDSIKHFVADIYQAIVNIRKFQPHYLIDLERCSAAIGIFRMCSGWIAGCKTMALDKRAKDKEAGNDVVWSLDKLSYGAAIEKIACFLRKKQAVDNPCVNEESRITKNKILININASAYLPQRRYSSTHFAQLIRALHVKNSTYAFYLTGSGDEYPYVQEVVNLLQQQNIMVYNVAGKWNLHKLVQQLSTCRLFITNDSGPMHLSVYMQIPTVVLWGPTHYRYFGYEADEYTKHISLNKPCSPCFTDPTSKAALACQGKISCMLELSPQWIAGKAESLIRQHTSSYRNWRMPKGMLQSELVNNLPLY